MNMKQRMNRLLSMLLACMLLIGLLPAAVLAAEDDAPIARTVGMRNGTAGLALAHVGRYDSGMTDADGGVVEIVAYNQVTGWAYVINGKAGLLTAIPLKDGRITAGQTTVTRLVGRDIDVKQLVSIDGFTYGDMTSVAVSPDGSTLAAAIQAEDYTANGRVALFSCNADGTLSFLAAVETGVQPDMVTFTPNGDTILTADEGEPRMGYSAPEAVDPKGSVTVIDAADQTAHTLYFDQFDGQRRAMTQDGIVLKKDTAPSVDLEPEYIAATDTAAYVSLQEANAIAVLSLSSMSFSGVYSAGFEDYSRVPVDLGNGDDSYAPGTYDALKGIRMPDGIALITVDGTDYLITANEGDGRAWPAETETDVNEIKSTSSPNGRSFAKKVTWFDSSQYNGLEPGVDYLFGGRSFSILKVRSDGLEELFSSGSDFERLSDQYLPNYFNCSSDELEKEDRSGKKGPEPETVVTGTVDGRTYAFVTLERIGGVMVYDLSDPSAASFVNYINSRDFSVTLGADDSIEGLRFISAQDSPTGEALLLAACEVGGTMSVYELSPQNNTGRFSDVPADSWYADAVSFVSSRGIFFGTGEGRFSPDAPMTRAMGWAVLARLDGQEPGRGANWYDGVRQWSIDKGISDGGDPDGTLTRERLALILYRYMGSPDVTGSLSGYKDSGTVSPWAADAMSWAVSEGLISGKDDKTLDPLGSATRAEVAAIIARFMAVLKD